MPVAADYNSDQSAKTLTFVLNLVQLSGKASLLGADHVTCRFTGPGLNIVQGGNGSGKSLFCSALYAAAFPSQTDALRRGLFEAGLRCVTLVGHLGDQRKEWTIEFETGEIIRRPQLSDDLKRDTSPISELVLGSDNVLDHVPHFVVNGHWTLPGNDQMEWACSMLIAPLERELDSWERRLDSLQHGEGVDHPDALQEEIQKIDLQLAHGQSLRDSTAQAEKRAAECQCEISDSELAIKIASAEESELVGKIELAERAEHLETWVEELRATWNSVESTRNQFAKLNERLEALQEMTRELPENVEDISHEYLRLQSERETVSSRLKENDRKTSLLNEQRSAVVNEKERLQVNISDDGAVALDELRKRMFELERELTELSRKRIDLVRRRDGLERQRSEKYRELSLLGPEEWAALEHFLTGSDSGQSSASNAETEKQRAELGRISERLNNEFDNLGSLSNDTPARIEKLFALRESVSKCEAELALLRSKVVEMQSCGSGAGFKAVLACIGAAAAGVPSGLILEWDIGLFAALVGGGAGFAIGHLLVPKSDVSREELVRKIDSSQREQQELLSVREALRLELSAFADLQSLDAALARWHEFIRLTDRRRALETAIAGVPSAPKVNDKVPAVLSKLEREDIRRRVNEYHVLTADLTDATVELDSFDHAEGLSARKLAAEGEALALREQITNLELQAGEAREQREQSVQRLSFELARIEQELAGMPDVVLDRTALRNNLARTEALDESVAQAFSKWGAESVLQAMHERNELQNELRETKSKLSAELSPQELAVRMSLIEDELKQVTEHLQELDPLFGTFGTRFGGLKKYREQMEKLYLQSEGNKHLIRDLGDRILALRLPELKREIAGLPSEQSLFHDRSAIQSRLDELLRSIHAAHNMCAALSGELTEVREHATARVYAVLQGKVFEAIGERFASVERSNGEWYVFADDGQRRPLSNLSRGFAELVMLCLNAGLLSVSSEAELAPIVWDDVLSQLDDYHLSIAKQVIEQLARDRQIVLLTRDPRIRAWGNTVEVLTGQQQIDAMVN